MSKTLDELAKELGECKGKGTYTDIRFSHGLSNLTFLKEEVEKLKEEDNKL